MESEVTVFHRDVWPDAVDQFALTNHIASTLQQGDQDVHGPAPELQRFPGSLDQPFGGGQPEWTELNYTSRGVVRSTGHL